mmetsp:Transcript_42071/g.85894  ORF Transcript_42071/g.85894 Transcript_42071/m.85894 type:complete len:131 (+) Transcript_42071:142-534(+)|eukprot:CAMPEP_0181290254 /NCGR_PEP_ID=MMETSP1101-20121128/1317_1 /TAXON_ID=46948 /ORGANISM="Rhodomonas abbreviata, Strain Caron Lab Isolate" /LENGTH=130 /DNA_ID=CAMNT_0023394529 /DNA_START=131 /DNA_END=523 /DNA_ORIENTATION=-
MPIPPVFQAFARVAMVAAPIVGKALFDAYKQAVINARAGGATALRSARMSKDEAAKILSVQMTDDAEKILERYNTLHGNNDPEKGGSQYLRDKIDIARKILVDDPLNAAKEAAAKAEEASKPGGEGGEKK